MTDGAEPNAPTADGGIADAVDIEPRLARAPGADVVRLVVVLAVLVVLALLLMAATQVTSGGCGGG